MIMVMMVKVLIEKMSSKVLEGEVSENIIEESNGCPRHEITGKQFHTNSPEKNIDSFKICSNQDIFFVQ